MSALEEWLSYSGHLDFKSGRFHTWKSRFIVLSENILNIFKDDTKTALVTSLTITDYTRVEALPPEGLRPYMFSVIGDLSCTDKLIFSAESSEILEIWMISLIQACRGSFSTSERFSLASRADNYQRRRDPNATMNICSSGSVSLPNTRSYYVNDETLMGRLRRSNLTNPDVKESLTQFYFEYFCFRCSLPIPPGIVLVRVCENQRYLPIKKWNCLHLLPTDPAKLSDASNRKFPYRYLKKTDPPGGYRWCTEETLFSCGISRDSADWQVDSMMGGEGGWRYAPSFATISVANSSGYVDFKSFTANKGDYVRRREWLRYAELVAEAYPARWDPSEQDGDESAIGTTAETVTCSVPANFVIADSEDDEEYVHDGDESGPDILAAEDNDDLTTPCNSSVAIPTAVCVSSTQIEDISNTM